MMMGPASSLRKLALATLCAAWGCGWAPAAFAAAPTDPPYPAGAGLGEVAAWLTSHTDVDLGAVVGVGDDSIFILEPSADPAPPPALRTIIRQEAIKPDFAAAIGGRSIVMVADIDCAGGRIFQRALTLYAGANKRGSAQELGAADDWASVPPGTFMDNVVAAMCDPGYQPIFAPQQAPPPAPPPAQTATAGAIDPRAATSLRPVMPSRGPLPFVAVAPTAPAAPAPAPASAPPPAAAPAPPSPPTPPPPAPAPLVLAAPPPPDGPIATAPMARAVAPPPQAAPATPPTPTPAPPLQTATPEPPLPPVPPPAPPAPPATAAPSASDLGLRPLVLGRAEIGVFESVDAAIEAWYALAALNPDMGDNRQRIELTTAGGQTRFRGFVDGFASLAEAEAFCRRLEAAGRACTAAE